MRSQDKSSAVPRTTEPTFFSEVGHGLGGVVFEGRWRNEACFIKVPPTMMAERALARATFERDVLQLSRLQLAGMPRVLHVSDAQERPYAVLAPANGFAPEAWLRSRPSKQATVEVAIALTYAICRLHAHGYVHGELTTEHVRVSETLAVQLLDLGSVHRPAQFDPSIDTTNLIHVLRRLASGVADRAGQRGLVARIDAWAEARSAPAELLRSLIVHRTELSGCTQVVLSTGLNPSMLSRPQLSRPVRVELNQLQQSFRNQTLAPVTVLLAPPGAGKTRVLSHLSELLSAQSVQVLTVCCQDSACAPFSTIQALLENHLRDLEPHDASIRARYEAMLRAAAGSFAPRLSLLSPRIQRVIERATSPAHVEDRAAFVDGLADFLVRYLNSLDRCVIIIDNLQYLDASSRMVLARLVTRLSANRQHIMGACTVDQAQSSESLDRFDAMLAPGVTQRVRLGPLRSVDALSVAAEFLGTTELSEQQLVEPLARLSDGTPMSLIQLLEIALEQRALQLRDGRWQLELDPFTHARLPNSSQRLVERRLAQLDDELLQVLRAAAVVRDDIEPGLLARVAFVDDDRARAALDRATAVALMVRDARGCYAFVHDSVCQALLGPVSALDRRTLHQAVADALSQRPQSSHHDSFALARHLALGVIEQAPARALVTLKAAGFQAARAHDDALTLLFLRAAERAAQAADLQLDRATYLQLAEASLRTGATTDSLRYFEHALARATPGLEAAHVLGRIAWLQQFDGRSLGCWNALTAALRELGADVPSDVPITLLHQGVSHVLGALKPSRRSLARSQKELETLGELYALCTRISVEAGKPRRGISALGHLLRVARRLPPCRVTVEAELLKAFALSVLSRHSPYQPALEHAYALAAQIRDPFAQTKCHQIHHVIAGWQGDIEQWVREAHACLEERMSYLELGEWCHMSFGMYTGLAALGKPKQGYSWLERAIVRAQHLGHAPAMFSVVEEAAYTHLQAFGRPAEADDLRRRLSHIQRTELERGGYFQLLSFQYRAQALICSETLGPELEALIDEWDGLGQKPAQIHIAAALFYIQVAHARLHQCLRASQAQRQGLLSKLDAALTDLEAMRSNPLVGSHVHVIRAGREFFRRETENAEASLIRAEQLARNTHCVWVIWTAARLRAHMLKARGLLPAAREQARFAAQLAREHAPAVMLRGICEEFGLVEQPTAESPVTRRHLEALLYIAQVSSRELSPERQAQFVLDELLQTLSAERGFLFMSDPEGGELMCCAARGSAGENLSDGLSSQERLLVEHVYESGRTALAPTGIKERAGVAVALVLRELVVGVIYLDRCSTQGTFDPEAVTLIEALANQVPVVLELAQALRERSRLERNLRESQKLEAVGRFAAGIAHDFNNILGTIEFSASCLSPNVLEEGVEDLEDIREAAARGAALTKQVMLLARGKSVPKERVELCETLLQIEPMIVRMLGPQVKLDLQFSRTSLYAVAEPSQIERVVTNLCRNASDAMPNGGTVTVRLSRLDSLPAQSGTDGTKLSPNGYAELCISDTGHGMSEETRSRLFEPFFTTKSDAEGTGLGLAIVYAIVQRCEGHIWVESTTGRGATFRVYFPLAVHDSLPDTSSELTLELKDSLEEDDTTAVCLVDDDETYRTLLARALSRAGYQVLTASSGTDALRIISDALRPPALVITDVQMPGLDGIELARRLRETQPELKVLFISGKPMSVHAERLRELDARLLPKPFSADALLHEIDLLLEEDAPKATQALRLVGGAY